MFGNQIQRSQRAGVRPGRYDEHAGSAHRRIGAGLALAAAAAAAALALTATSPAANADTIDLPDIPTNTGPGTDEQFLGVAPLFSDNTYNAEATYTDLLGVNVDTNTLTDPLQYVVYESPPDVEANGLIGEGITDPNSVVDVLPGGIVGGSTFGVLGDVINGTAFVNDYEETPFYPTGTGDTPAINDVFAYLPTAVLAGDSNLGFGVQYLDLPDASTPVDELNFFGSGGEILFSIPVTGDLLSGF